MYEIFKNGVDYRSQGIYAHQTFVKGRFTLGSD
jgi:hypothetical protein